MRGQGVPVAAAMRGIIGDHHRTGTTVPARHARDAGATCCPLHRLAMVGVRIAGVAFALRVPRLPQPKIAGQKRFSCLTPPLETGNCPNGMKLIKNVGKSFDAV